MKKDNNKSQNVCLAFDLQDFKYFHLLFTHFTYSFLFICLFAHLFFGLLTSYSDYA